MGAAASANRDAFGYVMADIAEQKQKPTDGSDVVDLEQARAEIVKLRCLFHMIDTESIRMAMSQATDQARDEDATTTSEYERGLAIVSNIRLRLEQRFDSLQESFLSIDTDRSGFISKLEFLTVCCLECSL